MNNKRNVEVASRSFPIFTLAAFAFGFLKLAEVASFATYSWWWAVLILFMPLIVLLSLVFIGLFGFGFFFAIADFIDWNHKRKNTKNRNRTPRI